MALNGSVTIDATPNSCDLLVFSWEATQDQKTNTSAINWTMNLVASEKYGLIYGVYAQKDWTVTIDGQETTGTADINIGYGETKTLASGTTVIPHESDGTKTFAFEFGINMDLSGWGSKTETHECPDCDGSGLAGDGGECPVCDGSGSLTSTSEGVYIGWQRGSGTGELDPIDAVKKFPLLDFVTGLIMARCSPRRAFYKPEPIGHFYGHETNEGETPTHIINGVDYVGAVLPDINDVWTDKETYPYAYVSFYDRFGYELFVTDNILGAYTDGCMLIHHAVTNALHYKFIDGEWVPQGDVVVDSPTPIWCSVDLYYLNEEFLISGNLCLDASTPIPIYDEPVAYSYNGVRLPKLPGSGWQYAYMCRDLDSGVDGLYEVILSRQPLIHDVLGVLTGELGTYRNFVIQPPYSNWEELSRDGAIRIYIFDKSHENVWCNVDILNEDGTIYLEASEPIPVYE